MHTSKWFLRIFMLGGGLLLFGLAACTATGDGSGTVEPVFRSDEAGDPVAKETAVAAQDTAETVIDEVASKQETEMPELLLIYDHSGGMKGIRSLDTVWNFYADGRVTASDGREWEMPAEDVQTLVDEILALGFDDFEASYMPEDTCCDRVTHVLTVYQDDGAHTVTVLDAADAPAELFQAITLVNDFLVTLPQ